MGVCCNAEEAAPNTELYDLPAPNLASISDLYKRFEQGTPFARTKFTAFKQALANAHTECGEGGFVTMEALSKTLYTPAWQGLKSQSSEIGKLLLSEGFKKPGLEADQIDHDSLLLFAILHCVEAPRGQKKNVEKSIALYEVLQDGGLEAHKQISATDKDMAPTFEKLCTFATMDVFGMAEDEVERIYSTEKEEQLKEQIEVVLEDDWLEEVYGSASRLENEAWLKAVQGKAGWVFDSSELRRRLFEKAGLSIQHSS